jgi:hypothetical protein
MNLLGQLVTAGVDWGHLLSYNGSAGPAEPGRTRPDS